VTANCQWARQRDDQRAQWGALAGPVLALLPSLALLAACHGRATAPAATASGAAEEVAVVNGRSITAAQVARQAAAAGVPVRTALDELVETELLVAEAERRGLAASPEVREAAATELVRRWLATSFERELTPAAIPDEELHRAYARNAAELDRPEMRVVAHVLVPFGASEPDPARKQVLRRRAEEVARRARTVHSAEEMMALAPALSDADIPLRAEELSTGPVGFTVKPFADAVFALPREGAVSDVVETRFGFHVIYLKQIAPARTVPFEQVAAVLRTGVWPEFRRREFARFVDGVVERHQVEVHPDRLEGEGSH
jgi:hypothetical protein